MGADMLYILPVLERSHENLSYPTYPSLEAKLNPSDSVAVIHSYNPQNTYRNKFNIYNLYLKFMINI